MILTVTQAEHLYCVHYLNIIGASDCGRFNLINSKASKQQDSDCLPEIVLCFQISNQEAKQSEQLLTLSYPSRGFNCHKIKFHISSTYKKKRLW